MVRSTLAALAVSAAAFAMAGCGSAEGKADGPRKQICGAWIGQAELTGRAGPWFVDASGRTPSAIVASAGSSPTWVQVSADCERGSQVSVSNPAVISITSGIKASDGANVAVLISPLSAGRATLDIAGRPVITFTVYAFATPIPTRG